MNISVKLPVIVKVDNVGAIFMADNVTAISHTMHNDLKYNHVSKYIEDE